MLSIHTYRIAVEELPNVKGGLQTRLTSSGADIVNIEQNDIDYDNIFTYTENGGSKWTGTVQHSSTNTSKNTNLLRLNFGNNIPHSNTQPSYSCYLWKRVSWHVSTCRYYTMVANLNVAYFRQSHLLFYRYIQDLIRQEYRHQRTNFLLLYLLLFWVNPAWKYVNG